ncbi:MAG: choice-of-anchor B family protein [Bacteroidota bacterium]
MNVRKCFPFLIVLALLGSSCNNDRDSPPDNVSIPGDTDPTDDADDMNPPDGDNQDTDIVPCVDGMAGIYPCNGFDLVGNVPLSELSANEGNDVWGWVDDASGREFALMGLDNGTAFIEITNSGLLYFGKLPSATGTSIWRDIKVYNDHAFIVSEAGGHGMQVFDLSRLLEATDLPITFTADAIYNGIGTAHNIVINENTAFAYPVGTARNDAFGGGVHFVDIQNPEAPQATGGYGLDGYTHDAQIVTYNGPDPDYQGREIFIGANEDRIALVDITDKNTPTPIATIDYDQLGYTHQGWFTEDQRYFLLGDEVDETRFGFNSRTLIFDFEDLDNPTFHMTYLGPSSAIDHNGYVLGNAFYLANYTAGLRVLDLSEIDQGVVTEQGFFDSYPANDTPQFEGAWSVYPYLPSGKLLVSDINSGLIVIQPSN